MLNVTETVENYSNLEIFPLRLFNRKSSLFRMYFSYWKNWINPDFSRRKRGNTKKTENLWGIRYTSFVLVCIIQPTINNKVVCCLFIKSAFQKWNSKYGWQGNLLKCWNKAYLMEFCLSCTYQNNDAPWLMKGVTSW